MISRRIFAAVALLCAMVGSAYAQPYTKAQLNAQVGVSFPSNTVGAITPQILSTQIDNVINSIMPTAPVVSGNLACFNGTTGLLQDCGSSNVILVPAICDGATDNTAIITASIAIAPSTGAIWQLPSGVCNVTAITLNKPGILRGTGMGQGGSTDSSTIIRGTVANSNVVTLAADGAWLRDLSVTSSVSAVSRVGAGVKATSNGVSVENVSSFGHQYGFWNQSQGAYYNRVYGSQNNSHGIFLDSTVAQNEVRIYNSEFDSNTGDGIHLGGTNQGAGARFAHITAAGNANGIYVTNYGDLWIINPELSINVSQGILLTSAGGSINQVSIVAPFVESTTAGDNIKISGATAVNITGGSSWAASGSGVNADSGSDIVVAGMTLQSNNVSGLRINNVPNSTFSTNNFSNTASTGLTQSGITWGTSAVAVTVTGNDLSASNMSTKESGTRPAGAFVIGNLGIPNTIVGASTHPNISAPSSPASGNVVEWTDTTDLRLHDKNSAGTIGTTVVASTLAAHNFANSVSSAGVLAGAQPGVSDLSGFGTGVQAAVENAANSAGGVVVPVNPILSTTAPVATTFCATSPSIPTNNGTSAFTINVGTSCSTSVGTVTMPSAPTGWSCNFHDVTTPASFNPKQTGGTQTTVTLTNYSQTAGTATNWVASEILRADCTAY